MKHQYEIPACQLNKLLSNPTLFSNHFDYYGTLAPQITARATATMGLHQARLTAHEVLVQPEKMLSATMETVMEAVPSPPEESNSGGFLGWFLSPFVGHHEVSSLVLQGIPDVETASQYTIPIFRRFVVVVVDNESDTNQVSNNAEKTPSIPPMNRLFFQLRHIVLAKRGSFWDRTNNQNSSWNIK